jgi:hypothetical protein
VTPNPLDEEVLDRAAARGLKLKVPGLSATQNTALASEFAVEAARILQEGERRDILLKLGIPLAEVTFDPAGIDESSLFNIADQLSTQMPTEVA